MSIDFKGSQLRNPARSIFLCALCGFVQGFGGDNG